MNETRERLLAATNEQLRRHGYRGTSLKQVTTAAEATVGSLYHFFPGGKDELVEATVRSSGAAYQGLFEAIADAADGVPAAITDFFDGAAEVLEATDFIDPCPIGTVAREVASTHEALREATDAVFTSWVDAARARLVATGVPGDEADELATALVAALEGGFVLARARRDGEPLRATGRQVRRRVEAALDAAAEPTR